MIKKRKIAPQNKFQKRSESPLISEYCEGFYILQNVSLLESRERAIQVSIPNFEDTWIPKSQIHEDSEVYGGCDSESGNLIVTEWCAEDKGLV